MAILPAVVVAGLGLWWVTPSPLSDGERAVIGTWRLHWDGRAAPLPVEYEYRPDRTCVIRYIAPASGPTSDVTWWRSGDTLVLRHWRGAVGPRWDVLGLRRSVCEVLTLTPDGPGRFRFVGVIEAGGRPSGQPPVSGMLIRSDSPP